MEKVSVNRLHRTFPSDLEGGEMIVCSCLSASAFDSWLPELSILFQLWGFNFIIVIIIMINVLTQQRVENLLATARSDTCG